MLKDFDKTANIIRISVVADYGSDFADKLYQETRQKYEMLMPQIPHISVIKGGDAT